MPFKAYTYTSAIKALSCLEPTLLEHETTANVILPALRKSSVLEMQGKPVSGQYWVAQETDSRVDLILSCTQGAIGTYPAFIFAAASYDQLMQRSYLLPRMEALVNEVLRSGIPTRRIYSVFAQKPVTELFVELWTQATGISSITNPYYDSWMSFCTLQTLVPSLPPKDAEEAPYELRKADSKDLEQTAELCRLFAADCEPFVLDAERAKAEAEALIRSGNLWICRVKRNDQSHIASLCAMTRNSDGVSTITKVFTNPEFRRKGYAGCLVQRVCSFELNQNQKKSVVLYVGTENSARFVYAKVGFVGLENPDNRPAGVDEWVEIGFDLAKVDLGHW